MVYWCIGVFMLLCVALFIYELKRAQAIDSKEKFLHDDMI